MPLTALHPKITACHLERKAVVYLRQSTPKQVRNHVDSQLCQRTLVERAQELGWHRDRITLMAGDLGQSASQADSRDDFKALAAEVALGHVGIVFGWDVSRLARNNADWYRLLDLAALFDTLIGDNDGIYDPKIYNDRLLLGLKGTMSEAELYTLRQRLNAGRLSKVQRGEYVQHLPTGLVRTANHHVLKDPDAQVQHVIELVLRKFEELGSCPQVMRYCKAHDILLPRYQTSGAHQGEVLWKKPSTAAVYSIVSNPAYAGAFAYGRRPTDPTRRQPGRPSTGKVRKPLPQWQCLIQDVYPAYISWQQYLTNQDRLKDAAQRYANQAPSGRGTPRNGAALLQGLATCGQCGRRMKVCYKPSVRYACDGLTRAFGEPMCAHLDGASIETFVVQAFFEAMAPAQLDALDTVLHQQHQEQHRLELYHQQQIQRCQYDATLARRRYEQVDPDNRLVAAELERQWEEALYRLREAQEAADRFATQPTEPTVGPQLRQRLRELNQHLPHLWSSDQLTNEQRKQLLRSLIAKVILTRQAPDQVHVKLVWVSGHFSEGVVRPPIWRQADMSNYPALLKRFEQLWQQNLTDEQIAQRLNEEGFQSARNRAITAHTVIKIRHQQGWSSARSQHQGAEKINDLWTVQGLAKHLGVKIYWIYNRIRNGCLSEADLIRQPQGNYLIRDDPHLMERLSQAVQRTRRSPQSHS